MYYLFIDSAVVCKWCSEPLIQVVENDPDKVVLRLCNVCDRWPPGLLAKESR